MGIADEKYVAFTTYKRNGDPVSLPVWIVGLDDGTVGFWTSSGSMKVKRLTNNPNVLLQPSDGRGKVKTGTEAVAGTARLVAAGDQLFDEVGRKVHAKYGVMTTISKWLGTIAGIVKRNRVPYGDRAVIVTLA